MPFKVTVLIYNIFEDCRPRLQLTPSHNVLCSYILNNIHCCFPCDRDDKVYEIEDFV
jgi:hypothetical protein